MSWDPTPYIEALAASAPAHLQKNDPAGLREYAYKGLLRHGERRPQTWSEFLAERLDLQRPTALVYDRPSGLVFLGGFGDHAFCAADLYHFRQLTVASIPDWRILKDEVIQSGPYSPYADLFLESGMGFVCGGVSAQLGRRTLTMGEKVTMTSIEKEVFKDYVIKF